MIPKNNAKKILPEPGFAKMAEIKNRTINTTIAIKLMIATICFVRFFIIVEIPF